MRNKYHSVPVYVVVPTTSYNALYFGDYESCLNYADNAFFPCEIISFAKYLKNSDY